MKDIDEKMYAIEKMHAIKMKGRYGKKKKAERKWYPRNKMRKGKTVAQEKKELQLKKRIAKKEPQSKITDFLPKYEIGS